MSTTPPEVKNSTLDANAEGAPTVAANENLTNATATAEAVATEEVATDESASLGAMEKTLDDSPDIKAAAATDAHVGEIEAEVENIGVQQVGEHLNAAQTEKALEGTGASVVGPDHPTHNLGKEQGTVNNEPTPPEAPSTLPGYNAFKSGQYANPETNGAPLNKLEEDRRGLLRFVPRWLLGGSRQTKEVQTTPDNIIQFPTKAASAEPVTKAA